MVSSDGTQEPFSPDPGAGTGFRKRNSCKVIVLHNRSVLLTRNEDAHGNFYLLPGGGQRFGETLTDAAAREVREETGYDVRVGRLRFVRDYIGSSHEFALEDGDVHQVEFIFLAELHPGQEARDCSDGPAAPDAWQTGCEWVSVEQLPGIIASGESRIYPSVLADLIPSVALEMSGEPGRGKDAVYLGDIN